MKLKFKKNEDYDSLSILDEIVRARLFEDFDCLDTFDNPEEMKKAYTTVLRYITVAGDKRLKKLDKY